MPPITLSRKEVMIGPDRVAPVGRLLGLDGSKTRVWVLHNGEEVEMSPRFLWQVIQTPSGDPFLRIYHGAYTASGHVLIGALALNTVGASGTGYIVTGFQVAGLVAGCTLICNSGPNAGTYTIVSVGNYDGVGYEFTVTPNFPATQAGFNDWVILTATTNTVFVPDNVSANFSTGDVVLVNGTPCTVLSIVDAGPPVELTVYPEVPAGATLSNLSHIQKAVLKNGDTAYPSFVPAVQGVYVLRAYVGCSYVPPLIYNPADGIVAISATASASALGLPVDASWIWRYLSDFWSRVSDRSWSEAMWRAAIRATASILQETWNVQLSASLATAGDVAMSRWLSYDAELTEPDADKVILERRSRVVFSDALDIADATPKRVEVTVHRSETPTSITVNAPASVLSSILNAYLAAAGVDGVSFRLEIVTDDTGAETYHLTLRSDRYVVEVSGDPYITGIQSTDFSGARGVWSAPDTFLLVEPSVASFMYSYARVDADNVLKPGDPINIDGVCYRIESVGTTTSFSGWPGTKPYTYVKVSPSLSTPVTFPSGPHNWAIPSFYKSPSTNFEAELVAPGDPAILQTMAGGTKHEIEIPIWSAVGYTLGVMDPRLWYDDADYSFSRVLRFFYVPAPDGLLSVPQLKVQPDDKKGWVEYTDYIVGVRRGRTCLVMDFTNEPAPDPGLPAPLLRTRPDWTPPDRFWAEISYLDQRPSLDARFGENLGLRLEDAPVRPGFSYAKALLGLWYCRLYGSKPANLERGVSIIMGAPFFEVDGMIVDALKLDETRGYLLVRDADDQEIVRSYIFPLSLGLDINPETGSVYAVGDTVRQFNPVSNATVFRDYISDPEFIKAIIAAEIITEPEKIHTFSVGMDSYFFHGAKADTIRAVVDFLKSFKTTYNVGLFSMIERILTKLDIESRVLLKTTLFLDSYPGQRWGNAIYDRIQLSGSRIHSYYGHNLDGREHFDAIRWYDAGASEWRIQFLHKSTGKKVDPSRWGMKAGDLFISRTQTGTEYQEQPILTVKGDPDDYITVGDPGWQWDDTTEDFAVVDGGSPLIPAENWIGYDNIRFYPRTHLEIRLMLGGVEQNDPSTGAPVPNPIADYPGPEQLV